MEGMTDKCVLCLVSSGPEAKSIVFNASLVEADRISPSQHENWMEEINPSNFDDIRKCLETRKERAIDEKFSGKLTRN